MLISNQDGFTLMELMTVVAIISILSAIAIPNFFAWRASSKLSSAARELMSDLAMARMQAISASESVKVLFFSDGYTVFVDEDNDDVIDADEEVLSDKNYPAGVAMSADTFPSGKTIFARTGIVSPAGSIVLDKGSGTRMKVIVSVAGRIRVETV